MSVFRSIDPEMLDENITLGEYRSLLDRFDQMSTQELVSRVDEILEELPVNSMTYLSLNELLKRFRRKVVNEPIN